MELISKRFLPKAAGRKLTSPNSCCVQAVKSSKPKRGKGKSSKKKAKKVVKEVDILSPAAMLNAYYICHNAPACLEFRGFPWPGSPKKKGKKGKNRVAEKPRT
ncbi:small lysine-rich protein 1 isoform 2-T2 [Pluvialis apricaria]